MAILRSVWQKWFSKTDNGVMSAPVVVAGANEKAVSLMANPRPLLLASDNTSTPLMALTQDDIPDNYLTLWQLQAQRQIVEVRVEGGSTRYQTLVLAIDIQRGLLWLDDLFPNQHALDTGDKITLRHHRHGEELVFSSPIVAWGNQYGVHGFAVLLPENLAYQPRRHYSRAELNHGHSLGVSVRALGQEIVYGSVQNISAGGLRFYIAGNLLRQFRHGTFLPLCELTLSNELSIRCSARVRAFRLLRNPYRHTQVSIEFVGLESQSQLQLQQFINNLLHIQQLQASELTRCSA